VARLLSLLVLSLVVWAAPAAHADSAPDAGTAFSPEPKSQPRFKTKRPADDAAAQKKVVEAGDGTDLYVETWLPDPLEGRVPTVLIATPYVQEDQERYPTRNLHPVVEWFTARGYAVAQHHIRGTGNSGGCLEQTAANQIDDVARVIEYLGRDAPWSNGAVGMYGHSYDAETQISVAGLGDPALTQYLKAIIPSATVAGQYEYSNFDGVPYVANAALSNTTYLGLTSLAPGTAPLNEHTLERFGCQGELAAGSADTTGDMTPFWQSREYRQGAAGFRAATLWLHGLADRNVQPITLAGFFDRLPPGTPHKALVGQWEHNYPDKHAGVQPDWAREDWLSVATAWYDRYLKQLDTGVEAWPAVQVQDSTGQWRGEPSFPQAGGPVGQLGLAAEGKLGGVAEPGGATTFGEAPEDQSRVSWETAPVAAPLHLVGQPMLDLVLSTDRADAHLAARLEVLGADGAVLRHQGSASDAIATYGFRSLRHLDPMPENFFAQAQGRPAPTGEPIRVPIRFHPNDLVVPAGGRLRVTLSGSLSYSRESAPSGNAATITVHHECGGKASALRFLMPHRDAPLLNVRETDEEGPLASAATEAGRRDGDGLASAKLCGEEPVRNDVLGAERPFPSQALARRDCTFPSAVAILRAKRTRRALTIRGTATAPCSRLAGVEVSVSRLAGRRCAHFTGKRFSKPVRCGRLSYFRARGLANWSFKAAGPGRGRLVIRARAYDSGGVRSVVARTRVR
jgi:predicted acyl esterase